MIEIIECFENQDCQKELYLVEAVMYWCFTNPRIIGFKQWMFKRLVSKIMYICRRDEISFRMQKQTKFYSQCDIKQITDPSSWSRYGTGYQTDLETDGWRETRPDLLSRRIWSDQQRRRGVLTRPKFCNWNWTYLQVWWRIMYTHSVTSCWSFGMIWETTDELQRMAYFEW